MKSNLDPSSSRPLLAPNLLAWRKVFQPFRILPSILLCTLTPAFSSQPPFPGEGGGPRLDTWLLCDTNWLSARGHAPVAFTNLSLGDLGYAGRLLVDNTNPAYLQYNVVEADGTTNLTVDIGSIVMWFSPDWAGTNQGGAGPQVFGRLFEAGTYTEDSSAGWFSLYVDDVGANLWFSAQANDGSSNLHSLSTPITWTNNLWHMVALTYCSTGTCIYLDGALATNGPGLSSWPGSDALTNGFFVGSDAATGLLQARGMFGDLATYRQPLSANMIAGNFGMYSIVYNTFSASTLAKAPSYPTNSPNFVAIAGPGNLTPTNNPAACVNGTNVWFTDVVATLAASNTVNVTFTIAGSWNGTNGPFDVFANAVLDPTNSPAYGWQWMGQGWSCGRYILTNLPPYSAYLILGTPQDSDGDGLTDAYERLVSKTDPHNPDSGGDGMLDGWKVLWGLNPSGNNAAQPPQRFNYTYDPAGFLKQVTGWRGETIAPDFEGNVTSDGQ